ncbi:MAG: glycine betaine ABC transporter substrate-binding protein [Rubrivivax sp.]
MRAALRLAGTAAAAALAAFAAFAAAVALSAASPAAAAQSKPLVVGSKRFTESYILGEIVCGTLAAQGQPCTHRQGLGNTGILEQALAAGEVDLYPEYTGTIVRAILKREGAAAAGNPTLAELNEWLAPRGLKVAVPLGFNNTYALAMPEAEAQRLGVARISDLARVPAGSIKPGLSHEFIVREDGWPALKRAYALPFEAGNALDHGLAADAVKAARVNLIDACSTDARIRRDGLRVLADDRAFFPRYDAVLLIRLAVDESLLLPLVRRIERGLQMTALNARRSSTASRSPKWHAAFSPRRAAPVARAAALATSAGGGGAGGETSGATASSRPTSGARRQHLWLVFASVLLARSGGGAAGRRALALSTAASTSWVLGAVGIVRKTVPSLALLAVLIAVLGTIGFWPALLALFVYALLPIVANTHAGLTGVPAELSLAARALGLKPLQGAAPRRAAALALPTIVAGAKTATVINVGTATVAAFVGAGGAAKRIVAGWPSTAPRCWPAPCRRRAGPAGAVAVRASRSARAARAGLRARRCAVASTVSPGAVCGPRHGLRGIVPPGALLSLHVPGGGR